MSNVTKVMNLKKMMDQTGLRLSNNKFKLKCKFIHAGNKHISTKVIRGQ